MRFDRTEKEIEERRLQNIEYFRRIRITSADSKYFRRELGAFKDGKKVCHLWDQGGRCLILETENWKSQQRDSKLKQIRFRKEMKENEEKRMGM